MEAYIANLNPNFNKEFIDNETFFIFLSGCNFRSKFYETYNFIDFKNEDLHLIKDLKKEIDNNINQIKKICFKGGEPTLQRQALFELLRFSRIKKLYTIIETNGTKPDTIKYLIKNDLIDEIKLYIKCPLDPDFLQKITHSENFFQNRIEILNDVKKTINLIKDFKGNIIIKTSVIPSLLFKKEDLLKIAFIVYELNATWELSTIDHEIIQEDNEDPINEKLIKIIKDYIFEKIPNINLVIKTKDIF